jgi:FXSXX-COOH protein
MNPSRDADESGVSCAGPERISLVRLAAQSNGSSSPALTRVVSKGAVTSGPGRVAVAAFNSSV